MTTKWIRALVICGAAWVLLCPAVSQAAAPEPAQVIQLDHEPLLGPYLFLTSSPFDSIRIAFRGTAAATTQGAGAVSYGIKDVHEKTMPFAPAAKHVIELDGLTPDTEYQYALKLGDYASPIYHFHTAPTPGKRATMKILLLADFHTHTPNEVVHGKDNHHETFFEHYQWAAGDMRKFDPDLVLMAGDNVNVGSDAAEYDTFFRMMRDILSHAPILATPGNHELLGDKGLVNYTDFLANPDAISGGKWKGSYGGIGFILGGVGTNPQRGRAWLTDAITTLKTKSRDDTLIFVQHYPIYQFSTLAVNGTIRGVAGISDVFDAMGGVRLCFCGHLHMHQRMFPLLDGQATTHEKTNYDNETKGTIYMELPSIWYQFATPRSSSLVACNGKPSGTGKYTGYVAITVTPESIVTDTYGYDDTARHELIDHFTVARPK